MQYDRRTCSEFYALVLLAQFFALLVCSHAVSVLQAYRLVQFDHNGVNYGSKASRISQYGILETEKSDSLFRQVILIPFKEATLQLVKELLKPAHGVSGLIFIIPAAENLTPALLEEIDMNVFLELESFLSLTSVAVPVYFVEETPDLAEVTDSIRNGIAQGKPPNNINGGHYFQIKSGAGKLIKNPLVTNFEGWLSGSEGNKPGKPISPTIVISAHYDSFSIAPGMYPGSGNNGSGIVVLLALIRVFKALYRNPTTQPKVNILFLLTGGSGMDFYGLQHWLKTTDTRILDSLELVLSLDSLSGYFTSQEKNHEVFFHYSKPPKETFISNWYDRFETAAKKENLKLNMLHKKVNLALPYTNWEHEHVAKSKFLAGTLSGRREGINPLFTSSLLDQNVFVDQEVLTKVLRVVGNAISSRLYHDHRFQDFQTFLNETELASDGLQTFITDWLEALTSCARMAPYSNPKDDFGALILRFLKEHTEEGSYFSFPLDNHFKYYDGLRFQLSIYKTAGVLFDVVLVCAVTLYLGLMFMGLKVYTQGWTAFMALFAPPQKKKRRAVAISKPVAQRVVSVSKK